MRKTIALVLVAAMMLMFIPMAFAATYSLSAVQNSYTYYDEDGIVGSTTVTGTTLSGGSVTKGGIAYISRPYDEFYSWQVPGNTLTGSTATWNKWINVKVVINVEDYANSIVLIEGAKYVTDSEGNFVYEFYCLPQAGGNTVSRTLALYDNSTSSKLMGYVNVSMVYSDVYTPTGYATTEGINQANTYAYIDSDGVIWVDVVYNNLVARMEKTSATNVLYSTISYYPIRVKTVMTDKDGNLFPAFTRVDINKTSASNLYVSLNEEVPNMPNWFYLTEDSEVWFEKRLQPSGTLQATLDVYVANAKIYSGIKDSTTAQVGFGRLANRTVTGEEFNQQRFNSWSISDLSLTANGVNEDAIRAIIDLAIEQYYTSTGPGGLINSDYYGAYAAYGQTADTLIVALETVYTAIYAAGGTPSVDTSLAAYTGLTDAEKVALLVAALKGADKTAFDAYVAIAANAGAGLTYLNRAVNALTSVGDWITSAKLEYRADVTASLQNQLQYNANLYGVTTDTIDLTLTKPNGEVSKLEVNIKYNAVSRIVAKSLTTLDASQKTITIVKGESVDVTVKAYQDQIPVTGQPIKFTSNDTNIATATSPNVQSTSNSNTTTITGVNVGTTTVRAYVQSNAYTSNAMGTKVEAETYITVNVVDPVAETPVETAPETTDFVCKVRKLWIRDGAGTSNSKLGYFSRNDIAKVIEVVNGWAKIEFNGGIAYASTGDGKYLSPK